MPADAAATHSPEKDPPKGGLKNWHVLLFLVVLLAATKPSEADHIEALTARRDTLVAFLETKRIMNQIQIDGSDLTEDEFHKIVRETTADYLVYRSFGLFSYTRDTSQDSANRVQSFGILGRVFAWP